MKNCIQKRTIFAFNFALVNIKLLVAVGDIHIEGTVSQNL